MFSFALFRRLYREMSHALFWIQFRKSNYRLNKIILLSNLFFRLDKIYLLIWIIVLWALL